MIASRMAVILNNQPQGWVISFRSKDDINTLSLQLSQIQQYADNLRAVQHEHRNLISTIAGLLFLKRYDNALALIQQQSESHQKVLDFITQNFKDHHLAGLLIGKYYRAKELGPEPVGWLAEKYTEEAGNLKIIGRSHKFFWCQMLMGDSADNVKGILKFENKLCGPAMAYSVLKDLHTVPDLANCVVDAYRKIDQNVLAEAYLLWLLRHPHENVWHYLTSDECKLSSENLTFLHDCGQRVWHKGHPDYTEEE